MKRTLALILAMMLLVSVFACTASAEAPKVIRYGHGYDATTLDPQNAEDDGSYFVINNIIEPLVVGYDGTIHPGVAESWETSEDGTVYTFHLRQSNWSDGTPLTAKDFVYAAQRVLSPDAAYAQAYSFYTLKNGEQYNLGECAFEEVGVKALDDYTLEYTLSAPSATFLFDVSGYAFAPMNQAACEKYGETYGAEADNMLTNGPFICTEWLHDSKITISKNENYWNAENVHIDEVQYIIGASGQVAVDLFMAEELDVAGFSKQDNIDTMMMLGMDYTTNLSSSNFIWMNCSGGSDATTKFMSNTNFRNAISAAISREDVMRVCNVVGVPADRIAAPTLVTASGKSWDEAYPVEGWSTQAEPEKAKEYLNKAMEELGTTVEEVPELVMVCFDSQSNMTKLQAIQDMVFQTLGINCVISPQPIQQMFALVMGGEFDFWVGGKSLETPDWLSQIGFEFSDGQGAIGGYKNEEYNAMFHAAETAATQEEREALLIQLENIIIEDMTTLHLFWSEEYTFTVPGLTGLKELNGYGPYFAMCEMAS